PPVLNVSRGVSFAGADGKSVQAVICLGPPAVQDRKIQSTIEHDFLTTSARGFQGPARSVQPDIDSLNQVPAEVYIIIFKEQDLSGKERIAHQPGDLLEHSFTWIVVGMCFSCEDELNRALRIVDEGSNCLDVLQNHVGTLVGSKTARKSDGQGVEA